MKNFIVVVFLSVLFMGCTRVSNGPPEMWDVEIVAPNCEVYSTEIVYGSRPRVYVYSSNSSSIRIDGKKVEVPKGWAILVKEHQNTKD